MDDTDEAIEQLCRHLLAKTDEQDSGAIKQIENAECCLRQGLKNIPKKERAVVNHQLWNHIDSFLWAYMDECRKHNFDMLLNILISDSNKQKKNKLSFEVVGIAKDITKTECSIMQDIKSKSSPISFEDDEFSIKIENALNGLLMYGLIEKSEQEDEDGNLIKQYGFTSFGKEFAQVCLK